jgi:hypothetical protein
MYFSAAVSDRFHLWRQRFPDGPVEQLTSGPTEEEGLAVHPNGRSLITSVGLSQQAVWLRDAAGERQLSVEGYASIPRLSADGKRVCYLVTTRVGPTGEQNRTAGELRVTDVKSGHTERLLPGQLVTGFDLSRDGRIAATVVDPDGGTHVWLASLDGRTSPRRVPTARGNQPRFGPAGEIIFRASGRTPSGLWRIHEDGSAAEEIPDPVGGEFRILFDQQNYGMSLTEALRAFAHRVPVLDARFFVTAVLTQRETGGNLSEVLDNLAAVIRERFKVKRHVRVVSAHGRITGWVLGFLPPALAIVLYLISPEHVGLLWTDPLGFQMLVAGLILQVVGILIIRRIVDVEY